MEVFTCSRSRAASEASSTTSWQALSSSLAASNASVASTLRCSAFFAASVASRASCALHQYGVSGTSKSAVRGVRGRPKHDATQSAKNFV